MHRLARFCLSMLSVLAFVLATTFAAIAFADKTITLLTTGSSVTSMEFDLLSQPGSIVATVCGRAPLQAGGFGAISCRSIVLSSGSIYTSVNSLATGTALTWWRGQEGL